MQTLIKQLVIHFQRFLIDHNVSFDGAVSFADEIYKIRGIYGYPPEPTDGWCLVNKGN